MTTDIRFHKKPNPKKDYRAKRKNRPIETIVHNGTVLNGSRVEATKQLIADVRSGKLKNPEAR